MSQRFDPWAMREWQAAQDGEWRSARDRHRAEWDGRRGGFRPDPAIAAEIEADWRTWTGEAS